MQKMMLVAFSTSLGSDGFHFQTVGTGAKIFLRIGAAGLAVAKCTFGLAKERQRPLFDSTLIRLRHTAQCRARGGTGAVAIAGRLQRVVAQGAAGELSGPGLYRFRCSQTWQVLDLLLGQNTSGCPETHARTSRDLNQRTHNCLLTDPAERQKPNRSFREEVPACNLQLSDRVTCRERKVACNQTRIQAKT